MANEATATTPDTCVVCGKPIEQLDGGHRRRRYCNNNNACKQAAHRVRQEGKRKMEVRKRWSGFATGTQEYLEYLLTSPKFGPEFAEGLARIIKHEQELVMPEPVLTLEEARQRAQWNNYTNPTSYLESTGRLFLSLLQTAGAETARQVAEAINHERGNERQAMRPLIAELEQTIETQMVRIAALEQELANEKAASRRGEKMLEQQHRELGVQLMKVGRSLSYCMLPLSQFADVEPDLIDIKAGKSHWNEVSYSLSPTGLLGALVFARHVAITEQVLKQERDVASEQAWHARSQQERIEDDVQITTKKYHQVRERLQSVEQKLDRYREIADLSSRERLEQQFMAIGAQIAYKWLLCGVDDGVDSWMSYMAQASDEQLVKAVAMAMHYAENLIGLEQGEQLRKANRRIQELERTASQQPALKTVS